MIGRKVVLGANTLEMRMVLTSILEEEASVEVVGEAYLGEENVTAALVWIQDTQDFKEQIQLMERIRQEKPELHIIVLSDNLESILSDEELDKLKEFKSTTLLSTMKEGFHMDDVIGAVQQAVDGAMPVKETPLGGIDLNPEMMNLQIKRDSDGIPLPLPQQPIEDMNIKGFLPVIINVTPLTNPLPILSEILEEEGSNLADAA